MRGRNPRRSYDDAGNEIAPPTVGSARAQSETTIAARCHDCRHHAIGSTARLPADLPIPDIALRLCCSSCGGKRIGVMMDLQAHYARTEAETEWKMEVRPFRAMLEPDA